MRYYWRPWQESSKSERKLTGISSVVVVARRVIRSPMNIVIPILMSVLMLWNAAYCAAKLVPDFQNRRPIAGVLGLLAMAGVLAPMVLAWYINGHGS